MKVYHIIFKKYTVSYCVCRLHFKSVLQQCVVFNYTTQTTTFVSLFVPGSETHDNEFPNVYFIVLMISFVKKKPYIKT